MSCDEEYRKDAYFNVTFNFIHLTTPGIEPRTPGTRKKTIEKIA